MKKIIKEEYTFSNENEIFHFVPGRDQLNFNGFGNNLYMDNISLVLDRVLPVTFSYFRGEAKDGNSYLSWETASEYEIQYYQLEQSKNGIDFIPITIINGKGDSELGHHYQYLDEYPFVGNNYYRLISIYFNGEQHHSKSIVVFHDENTSISSIKVFPNPSNGIITIQNANEESLMLLI